MDRVDGFTVIELLTVIVIIGILTTLAVVSPITALASARDSERSDDVASIARLLEQDYTNQIPGGPQYPTATTFASDASNGTGTASVNDKAIFKAPNATNSSVVASLVNTLYDQNNSSAIAANAYVYQPLTRDGQPCASGSLVCASFRLYYRNEVEKPTIVMVRSLHQQ